MSIKPKFAGLFGLAAVAALLVMAVGASTAFAFPEFKSSTGKFPVPFKGTGGAAKFESSGKNTVTCEKSKSTGEVKEAISALVTITYEGKCELKGIVTEACPSITTKSLLVMPVIDLPGGKPALLFSAHEGAVAEFTCTGSNKVKVKVTGSIVCLTEPTGKFVKEGTVTCKKGAAAGSQEDEESENAAKEKTINFLEAESTLGIFKLKEKDSQETTEKVTYETAEVEIT